MMDQSNRPSKEQVREWLMHRQVSSEALPYIHQIRRELGWRPEKEDKNVAEPVDGLKMVYA